MRHLCTEETVQIRRLEGGVDTFPVLRYRELGVIRHYGDFYIMHIPEGCLINDEGHPDEEAMIKLMIEIDKLSNNWIGLSQEEFSEIMNRSLPFWQAIGLASGPWRVNEDYDHAAMNGYDNG